MDKNNNFICKKSLLITASVCLLAACQKPLWTAILGDGQSGNVYIKDSVLLNNKTSIVTGGIQSFTGADKNGKEFKGFDIHTVMYDASGKETWSAVYSGPYERQVPRHFMYSDEGKEHPLHKDSIDYAGGEEGQFVEVDAHGNVYVVGRIHGEQFAGTQDLKDQDWDVVLLKYSDTGDLLAETVLEDIHQFDSVQQVFWLNDSLVVGLNNGNRAQLFQFDASLNAVQAVTYSDETIKAMAVNDSQMIALHTLNSESSYFSNSTGTIRKISGSLEQEWLALDDRYYYPLASNIVIDSSGAIYLSKTEGWAEFGSWATIFSLVKYSSDGIKQWDRGYAQEDGFEIKEGYQYTDLWGKLGSRLQVDSVGNVYWGMEISSLWADLEGMFTEVKTASTYIRLQKLNPSGELQWDKRIGRSHLESESGYTVVDRRLTDMLLTADDNILLTYHKVNGSHETDLQFDHWPYEVYEYNESLKATSSTMVSAKYDQQGKLVTTYPTVNNMIPRTVSLNDNDELLVSGDNWDFLFDVNFLMTNNGYLLGHLISSMESYSRYENLPNKATTVLIDTAAE